MKEKQNFDEASWALYLANKLETIYNLKTEEIAPEYSVEGENDCVIVLDAYMRCFCELFDSGYSLVHSKR